MFCSLRNSDYIESTTKTQQQSREPMFNYKAYNRRKEMPLLEFGPEGFLRFSTQQLVGDDDEVYEATGSGPGSIRDIWKKFELPLTPLTPPLSPSRQTSTSGAASPSSSTSTTADTLQCVSDILDIDSCRTMSLFSEHSCTNLTSKLIQDCMWGSHSLQDKVQRGRRVEDVYDTPCSTPPSLYALDCDSAECVAPSSVFPYHINNELPSGESSSEDEIDVVTIIEKPVKRKRPASCKNDNNNNISGSKTSRLEPVAKRAKMSQRKARENTNKETKELSPSPEPVQDISNTLNGRERVEESECKRNVHNVLERKRRNDLKYSFQVLRDSIPVLKGSERAPKVAILRKATDCILNLRSEQESLLEQKHLLEKSHQSKLQRLKSLKESS